jgi:hypothetical protein
VAWLNEELVRWCGLWARQSVSQREMGWLRGVVYFGIVAPIAKHRQVLGFGKEVFGHHYYFEDDSRFYLQLRGAMLTGETLVYLGFAIVFLQMQQ